MVKQKKEQIPEGHDDITINLKESSVAEFTKRPVPTREEVEQFEEIIEDSTNHDEFFPNNTV